MNCVGCSAGVNPPGAPAGRVPGRSEAVVHIAGQPIRDEPWPVSRPVLLLTERDSVAGARSTIDCALMRWSSISCSQSALSPIGTSPPSSHIGVQKADGPLARVAEPSQRYGHLGMPLVRATVVKANRTKGVGLSVMTDPAGCLQEADGLAGPEISGDGRDTISVGPVSVAGVSIQCPAGL